MTLGGRSIEEWKYSISYEEAQNWMAFRNKRGGMDLSMRLEFLFARLSYQVHHAAGGKKTEFSEFMRFQEEEEASFDDFAKFVGVKKVQPHG